MVGKKMTLAWHFTGNELRDGRPLPAIGETLIHTGSVIPCRSGYHASERLIDALTHAPGLILWRVRLGGRIISRGGDKLVASERTGLWKIDATDLLRNFARQCALDVAHLWDMPALVRDYLETGREDIRAAAHAAAHAAAGNVAAYAACAAAYAALDVPASAATYAATYAAAYDTTYAVRAATRDAQNQRLTKMVQAEAKRLGYADE